MNKRKLMKELKDMGLEPEEYQLLTRQEMQALHNMFMLGLTFEVMIAMFRVVPALQKMAKILQEHEGKTDE